MLKELRQKRPLVHNITNYVAVQFVANGLLALEILGGLWC